MWHLTNMHITHFIPFQRDQIGTPFKSPMLKGRPSSEDVKLYMTSEFSFIKKIPQKQVDGTLASPLVWSSSLEASCISY